MLKINALFAWQRRGGGCLIVATNGASVLMLEKCWWRYCDVVVIGFWYDGCSGGVVVALYGVWYVFICQVYDIFDILLIFPVVSQTDGRTDYSLTTTLSRLLTSSPIPTSSTPTTAYVFFEVVLFIYFVGVGFSTHPQNFSGKQLGKSYTFRWEGVVLLAGA